MKTRGFEVATGWNGEGINLPERKTAKAAGYDFQSAADVTIDPIWKHLWRLFIQGPDASEEDEKILKPTLVPTGIKAYMQDDERLDLYNRSSNPLDIFLMLANSLGLIDADYYGNPKNDGHIMFQFINFGFFPKHIKKGQRIGQGVFSKFLKADGDNATGERTGFSGSTGR